ncbi:MAG: two-component system response regulator PilR [Acidobacteriota bacterium]
MLVVEDDPATSRMVTMALKSAGLSSVAAASLAAAREALAGGEFRLILCDLYLGDGTGLELLRAIRRSGRPAPVVMITAQGSVETAVEAIREGAVDYLAKPFQVADLLGLVRRVIAQQESEPAAPPEVVEGPESILVGSSPPMVELYKRIALAARGDSPVLIYGETGTGKELVARCLHRFSPRRDRPFVPVNCGALTETLLETELFGHERGAFTGAVTARKGLFEQAHGGTLFLDEITETSTAFQVKLLRVLQEGEVRPVGGSRSVQVDVRVVAATNRDLGRLMAEGKFRQDLYYRLGVVELTVPPLRERRQDIPALVSHFLKQASGRLGRSFTVSPEAMKLLQEYSWPGNVRELENVLERAAVLKTDSCLVPDDLPLLRTAAEPAAGLSPLELAERKKIEEVLAQTGGNRTLAARRLGIERKSLYRKAERLGIDLDAFGGDSGGSD